MEIDRKLIGIRIMQRRKEFKLTQEQLAEKLGMSKNHLSNIERGVYLPTTQMLFQLCSILGETPDYYLIGKFSTETDELVKTIKRLPQKAQEMLTKLIAVYLDMLREQ